jgi:antitoxin HicB
VVEEFSYPVVLEAAAEGGFVVKFLDVPEALTQGENEEEALARAVDALETALEMYLAEGDPLPVPSKAKRRQRIVTPSALAVLKLSIYSAMVTDKVRKTELARRLGMHLMQIDRLLDLNHASRIDQLELALRVGQDISEDCDAL